VSWLKTGTSAKTHTAQQPDTHINTQTCTEHFVPHTSWVWLQFWTWPCDLLAKDKTDHEWDHVAMVSNVGKKWKREKIFSPVVSWVTPFPLWAVLLILGKLTVP